MTSKSRFTTTDVKAMVGEIRSIALGQRVANIYDINDKTYLFKFAVPGKSEKIVLLLESGIRFHTTRFTRDKSNMPQPFTMKLRRYIRTKRLEDVRQLGADRVVDFKFGSGESVSHIILELYAGGNIILTDNNFEIQALLRSHEFEEDVAIKVGHVYPISYATGATYATGGEVCGVLGTDCLADPHSFRTWALNKGLHVLCDVLCNPTSVLYYLVLCSTLIVLT